MVNEAGNNGAGGGRKKNRSRGKKKNKGASVVASSNTNPDSPPLESAAEFVPPPVEDPLVLPPKKEVEERPKEAPESKPRDLAQDLFHDDDFVAKSFSLPSLEDAEATYYSSMGKFWKPSDSEDEGGKSVALGAPKAAKKPKASLPKECSNSERSFIMLKPDAVQRNLVGDIIRRFEARGFKLIALKLMMAPKDLLREHYGDLASKPFFPDLMAYMASGPVLPMVWEGLNVVKSGRDLLGATNPADSLPGTIRGDFCIDVGRNIIHGSDSVLAATKEISLWFRESELNSWTPATIGWIYEDESPPQVDGLAALAGGSDVSGKIAKLESDNAKLHKAVNDLKNVVLSLQDKVSVLEKTCGTPSCGGAAAVKKPVAAAAEEDDDDVDLFGSDSEEEEDAEKARIRDERLKAYHEKKAKKPGPIAKTSVLLDVKPWDDTTDMDAMLKACKTIQKDGLVWGASKLVPVGYGIQKLQVICVVEDEKVSIDQLSEEIEAFEDFVQSVDVAAMSKI